jgi:cell division septal protein FtsQ
MRHIIPPARKQPLYQITRPRRTSLLGRVFRRKHERPRREFMMPHTYDRPVERRMPRWIGSAIVCIAVVLLVQGVFQMPFLRVTDVSVQGLQYVPQQQVQEFIMSELHRRRWVLFKNDNYFLLSSQRLQQRLGKAYPLQVLSLKKQFPRSLQVIVKERIAGFVLQTPTKYISLDTQGQWMNEVNGPQPHQLIIADERALPGTAIPLTYLEQITAIKDTWSSIVPELTIVKFHITDDQSPIILSTNKNFKVYMSPTNDIKQQLQRLAVYVRDAGFDQPHECIDLSFGESLFIK